LQGHISGHLNVSPHDKLEGVCGQLPSSYLLGGCSRAPHVQPLHHLRDVATSVLSMDNRITGSSMMRVGLAWSHILVDVWVCHKPSVVSASTRSALLQLWVTLCTVGSAGGQRLLYTEDDAKVVRAHTPLTCTAPGSRWGCSTCTRL
jgi:hypothetical protein